MANKFTSVVSKVRASYSSYQLPGINWLTITMYSDKYKTCFIYPRSLFSALVLSFSPPIISFACFYSKRKFKYFSNNLLLNIFVLIPRQQEPTVCVVAVSNPPPLRYISVSKVGQITVWNSSLHILRSLGVSDMMILVQPHANSTFLHFLYLILLNPASWRLNRGSGQHKEI